MAMSPAQKQLLIALPVFALIVFAVCKLLPGAAEGEADDRRLALAELSAQERKDGGIRFSIDFPAERPQSGTVVLTAERVSSYPRPALTQGCTIDFATDAGKLYAAIPEVPGVEYEVTQLGVIPRRQPDGSVHPQRQILISGRTKAQDGSPVEYLLQLEVDVLSHTADAVNCTAWQQRRGERFMAHYSSQAPTGLPEKHSGSHIQRRISYLVHALAAIDSPEKAQKYTGALRDYAWELAHDAPYPTQPWPRCWGNHADDARSAAGLITLTLLYFKENNCFDCAELAAFINSAPFGIIFGNRFTAHPEERLQDTPIEFIPVSAHE